MAKFKLKEGVVLRPFGPSSQIDNSNLTDEIAEFLLASGRAKKEDFETVKNTK
jgi:hypothetical protein